ncbi:unnamed protein product, partial [Adineta ricciae]
MPVNIGQMYIKSNERSITMLEEWIRFEKRRPGIWDQEAIGLLNNVSYRLCNTKPDCDLVKRTSTKNIGSNATNDDGKVGHRKMAAVRTYSNPFQKYSSDFCPPSKQMDPCDSSVLYVHIICTIGKAKKVAKTKKLGFWMLQDYCQRSMLKNEFANRYNLNPVVNTQVLVER